MQTVVDAPSGHELEHAACTRQKWSGNTSEFAETLRTVIPLTSETLQKCFRDTPKNVAIPKGQLASSTLDPFDEQLGSAVRAIDF